MRQSWAVQLSISDCCSTYTSAHHLSMDSTEQFTISIYSHRKYKVSIQQVLHSRLKNRWNKVLFLIKMGMAATFYFWTLNPHGGIIIVCTEWRKTGLHTMHHLQYISTRWELFICHVYCGSFCSSLKPNGVAADGDTEMQQESFHNVIKYTLS